MTHWIMMDVKELLISKLVTKIDIMEIRLA